MSSADIRCLCRDSRQRRRIRPAPAPGPRRRATAACRSRWSIRAAGWCPAPTVTLVGLEPATQWPRRVAGQDRSTRASRSSSASRRAATASAPSFPASTSACCETSAFAPGDNRHVVVLPLRSWRTASPSARDDAGGRGRPPLVGVRTAADARSRSQALVRRPGGAARASWRRSPAPTRSSAWTASRGSSCRRRRRSSRSTSRATSSRQKPQQPGATFVDVITQPGVGPLRGTANVSLRDGSMSGRASSRRRKRPGAVPGLRRQRRRHAGPGQKSELLGCSSTAEQLRHAES